MVRIITLGDVFSYWGMYIIRELTNTEIKVDRVDKLTLDIIEQAVADESSEGVVLLGIPLEENQIVNVDSKLGPIQGVPFLTCSHYANWGAKLRDADSYVHQEVNYVTTLVESIIEGREAFKFVNDDARNLANDISDRLQAYHSFAVGEEREEGDLLILLSDFYREDLVSLGTQDSVEALIKNERGVLNRLDKNKKHYINQKISQARINRLESGTIVVSLFAERFVNEIGDYFIRSLSSGGYNVIVMIGHTTKGDDLHHIRTSDNINADNVAKTLNNGGGKDRTATVFLPEAGKPIYNTICEVLNSADI